MENNIFNLRSDDEEDQDICTPFFPDPKNSDIQVQGTDSKQLFNLPMIDDKEITYILRDLKLEVIELDN